MRHTKIKQAALLLGLILQTVWCGANENRIVDGYSAILVKEANVQSMPKGSSIQASINGHYLTVVFTENLGQVNIEITSILNDYLETDYVLTPNGLLFYIPFTGDYIITFTLPNGDEYYGEFTVTD